MNDNLLSPHGTSFRRKVSIPTHQVEPAQACKSLGNLQHFLLQLFPGGFVFRVHLTKNKMSAVGKMVSKCKSAKRRHPLVAITNQRATAWCGTQCNMQKKHSVCPSKCRTHILFNASTRCIHKQSRKLMAKLYSPVPHC